MVQNSGLGLATDEVAKAEELLQQTLPAEFHPQLKRLIDAQAKQNAIMAETFFIDGLNGAPFVMGILDDPCGNLEPF